MTHILAKPNALDVDFDQAAIVVVDMQNGFASKGGMFDLADLDITAAEQTIKVNERLLAAARRAGVKVIYVQIVYKTDLSDAGGPLSPNYHKELSMVQMREKPEYYGKLLTEGSWDAAIVDALTPQKGDHVVTKTRYTDLQALHLMPI